MAKLRAGIIGCGGIAQQKHMGALATVADKVEIVAFCDIIEERAAALASKHGAEGAKVYVDYRNLLEDQSIDVVYVLTPNVSHAQITIDALEAGKHVMCEKPMAINSAEARQMVEAAERTGKKLTIGYQNRFRKDSQTLFAACHNGDLGDIYFAKAHAVRRRAVPTWGVFQDKEKQGGGPLIDIGTHALDLALWTMNNYKPKQVSGTVFHKLKDKFEGNQFGPWDPATFNVEDSAFGFIKMENGATIYLEAAWALNMINTKEAQLTLCGTEAGAEMLGNAYTGSGYVAFNSVQLGQQVQTEPSKAGEIAYFQRAGTDPGALEAKQWIEAILEDKEPLVKPEQALVVTQILEAIYLSAETGKTIEL
ncbi:Gfo/Idh/MocA family protein [Cohnella fermenti]|uniref:Gfo/Idh/MocA family oxidoreductase n=1 Tax=Cohnella fermenti TaxID=2565925 RepID=A0A4S4BLX8_9BACL|nr:Gfo/Idh/MocA family oxidoreductase [Cohnella fermenti]THF75223.1 Gfo/Idh/MocA family oxidoreductase [Cohnella fermenti]